MPRTRLSEVELAEVAKTYGLGRLERWRAVDAGTVNSNYQIEAGGRRLFVRVVEANGIDGVAYEVALLDHLHAAGIRTPGVLATPSGERWLWRRERPVMVFEWVDGVHRDERALSPQDTRQVGAELAALHRATVDFDRRTNRYDSAAITGRFEGLRDLDDPVLAPTLELLGAELAVQAQRAPARAALPTAVIHQDLFPDNVLFTPEGRPVLLDFEQAAEGAMLFDLAVVINAWCIGDDFGPDPARLSALIDGYGGRGDLEAIGGTPEALWHELRVGSVRFAVTRITDVYLTGIDRPDKDFRHYTRRLERWRQIGAGGVAALL